jgi:glucose dehydrogenase
MRKRLFLLLAVAAVLIGWLNRDRVSAQAPAANAPNFVTWDGYLGGPDSSQFSSLTQVNKENVAQLQQVWNYNIGANNAYLFNPLIVDGTMYVLSRNNSIVALNAATGAEIWTHENQGAVPARGINYWENADRSDRRLVYPVGGFLQEVDARTGQSITSFGENGRVELKVGLSRDLATIRNVQTSNPGKVVGNVIVISLGASAGGDSYSASPGDVHGYDAITGKLLWVFHAVPEPGEEGYDTWPADAYKWAGGVHNWNEMSADAVRGIVYIPFGTARYDFYGAPRPGQNLFGNSLVAIDTKTGKRIWHQQLVHHDLWDYDLPQAPKLLTVMHDGRRVDVVAQATKQGFLFVFNRETGEPLWPIEERPVPKSDVEGEHAWPTQPFPTAPPPFARQKFTEADINPFLPEADKARVREWLKTCRNEGLFTPPSLKGTIEMPGNNGGANWGSSGVDPIKGTMFVVSKELPMIIRLNPPGTARGASPCGLAAPAAAQAKGGQGKGGGAGKGKGAPAGPPPPPAPGDFVRYGSSYEFLLQSNGLSAISPPWSQLTAYDLNTGTIKWQVPNGEVAEVAAIGIEGTGAHFPRGGVVVTASGLVFVATASDKTLRAYDADSGKVLWKTTLPNGSEGVPSIYEVDGREYLVVPAAGNNGLMAPRLNNGKAAAFGPGGYIAFALR